MRIIRQVGEFQLYFEPLQRMYAVSDMNEVSLWFDSYTKDELLELSDEDFVEEIVDNYL